MEVFKGINFEILCEGQPLTLYEDPDKDQKEVNENAKLYYVEAVAGAQFVPKVTLNPSHSLSGLKEDDMVKIKLSPDGANSYQKSLSKRSIERSRQMGQSVTTVFTRHIYREPASERWVEGQLSFSDLAIREDDGTHRNREQSRSAAHLGSILIVIRHAESSNILAAEVSPSRQSLVPNKSVSEKVIKGKSITNSISLANVQPTTPLTRHQFRPVTGRGKFHAEITILYRSRAALESLGCISRAPTPEPQMRDELQALRARVAELEREAKPDVKGNIVRSRTRRPLKHELDDDEEGFLPPVTRRRVETIHLTDD